MAAVGSIGIDVGARKTLLALFDRTFRVIDEIKLKTQDSKTAHEFAKVLDESLRALLKKGRHEKLNVEGVGIGCAGVFTKTGMVKVSPNIAFLKRFSFRALIAKRTPARVIVMNDAEAGLYGEYKLGAAKGRKNLIGIFVGSGIGGALIIDGKLYSGRNGVAGDLGHFLLHPVEPLAGSNRQGVLDDIVSRTALAGDAAILATKKLAPYLLKSAGTDVRAIGSRILAEAIAHGDRSIEQLVRNRCQMLGIVLSNLVDFINPDMIVLGGGLTEAMPEIVRHEVTEGIRNHSTKEAYSGLEVVVAKLKDHSVTKGAAKRSLED